MDFDSLLHALQENAAAVAKPRSVEIPNVGTLYVRRRTIAEIDDADEALPADAPMGKKVARGLIQVLCDENGVRFTDAQRAQLMPQIEGQPETVLQSLSEVADGEDQKKVTPEGN